MNDFQSGLEAFAKSSYQKYLEIVLKGKLGLEEKVMTTEEEKEFKEDIESIYKISKIQDVAQITDLSGNAICLQSKNSFPTVDENEGTTPADSRRGSRDGEEIEREQQKEG